MLTSIVIDISPAFVMEGNQMLILMKRVPGVPVSEAWPNLTTPERETIARETAEYLLQLRKLSAAIQFTPTSCSWAISLGFLTVLWHLMVRSGQTWSMA